MNAKGLLSAAMQSVHDVASDLIRQEAEQQKSASPGIQGEASRNVDAHLLAQQLDQANAQVDWLHQSAVSGIYDEDQAQAFPGQLAFAVSQRDALAQKLNIIRQGQQQAAQRTQAQQQLADVQQRDQLLNAPPTGQAPKATASWLSDAG